LKLEEVAQVLGVSPTTVSREWLKAKLFLKRQLSEPPTMADREQHLLHSVAESPDTIQTRTEASPSGYRLFQHGAVD